MNITVLAIEQNKRNDTLIIKGRNMDHLFQGLHAKTKDDAQEVTFEFDCSNFGICKYIITCYKDKKWFKGDDLFECMAQSVGEMIWVKDDFKVAGK